MSAPPPGANDDWLQCVYCLGWGPPKLFAVDFGTQRNGTPWRLGICHHCGAKRAPRRGLFREPPLEGGAGRPA